MHNSINHSRIDAVYACVPSQEVKTVDYSNFTAEEAQVFTRNTGVVSRRVAADNVTCSDLCFEAAMALLTDFNVKQEIDLLVFVSQSPDYFLPATSILLQERLGLKDACLAFDVNLGCSGFVYGLNMVGQFIQSGAVKKALFLVGDKSTISTAVSDKSTFPLFGDAGAATLISFDHSAASWHFDSGTDGSGKNAIIIEGGHSRNPYGTYSEELIDYNGNKHSKSHLHLEGLDVFNFALARVPISIESVLNLANTVKNDIDFYVLHQANGLITKTIARKMGLPMDRLLSSIAHFGNTSSASIPLTLVVNSDIFKDNKTYSIVLSGFGVGFSWASVYMELTFPATKLITYGEV